MKIEELFFWARWSALGSLGGFVAATKWLNVSRIHALIYGAHSSICYGHNFPFRNENSGQANNKILTIRFLTT